MTDIKRVTKEMSIGEVLEKHPVSSKVFVKYFGQGCFTCPGAQMEDIAFGAAMHGMDAEKIVAELNGVIEDNG